MTTSGRVSTKLERSRDLALKPLILDSAGGADNAPTSLMLIAAGRPPMVTTVEVARLDRLVELYLGSIAYVSTTP